MDRLDDVLRLLNVPTFASVPDGELAPDDEVEACPLCEGRGFISHDVSAKHPDFGKLFPCSCRVNDLFGNVRRSPLLVLDDLGTQSSTPWAMEKLYQLFNSRYNNRLATVVTTNHSLEDVDERLRVRLTDPDFARICYLQPPQSAAFQRLGGTLDLLRHMTFEVFSPEGQGLNPQQAEGLRS